MCVQTVYYSDGGFVQWVNETLLYRKLQRNVVGLVR